MLKLGKNRLGLVGFKLALALLMGCLAVAFSSSELVAQVARAKAPASSAKADAGKVSFNPGLNPSLERFVRHCAGLLKMNYQAKGNFSSKRLTLLYPTKKLAPADVRKILENVLRMNGFMLVEPDKHDGIYTIVPIKDAIKDYPNKLNVVSEAIDVKHVKASEIERRVKHLLTKNAGTIFSLTSSGRNAVVVTDFAKNVLNVKSAISVLDMPRPTVEFTNIFVKHVPVSEMAQKLEKVYAQTCKLAGQPLSQNKITADPRTNRLIIISTGDVDPNLLAAIKVLDQPGVLTTKKYKVVNVLPQKIEAMLFKQTGLKSAPGQYSSYIDNHTGNWVVTTSKQIHSKIKLLCELIDVASSSEQANNVRFYKLKNRTASDVLATILSLNGQGSALAAIAKSNQVKDRISSTTGKSGIINNQTPPAGTKPAKSASDAGKHKIPGSSLAGSVGSTKLSTSEVLDAIVTADADTNSIIVVAPEPLQKAYKMLIDKLDQRRPQVMVEVTLVSIDTSDDFTFGVELSSNYTRNNDQYITFSSFGLSTRSSSGEIELTPSMGFNGAVIRPQDVSVIIKALEGNSRIKILSVPKILANDNSSAQLSSELEQAFISTSQSSSTTTTSFGGYATAGTNIQVTPHISEGDHLQLKYSVKLSSFTSDSQDGIPGGRSTSELSSEITIPNGHAVIVGGLKRVDISEGEATIPFLGRIPWLKYMMGNFEDTKKSSKLFVFIRPIILRDYEFDDLKYLSEQDRKKAELPAHFPKSEFIYIN